MNERGSEPEELDPKRVPPRLVAAQRVIAERAFTAAEKRLEMPLMVEGESPTRRRSRRAVGARASMEGMVMSPTSGAEDAAGQWSRPMGPSPATMDHRAMDAGHTARWLGFGVMCSPEQVGRRPCPAAARPRHNPRRNRRHL